MSENRFTPAPRKKISLDNNKLNLSAECPTAAGKYSKLLWGFHNNNPRITVYTGDPSESADDPNYGRIVANLDLPVLYTFFEMMELAINAENGFKTKIENKNFTFFGGKRSAAPVLVSELWVGKDKEGLVWISIVAKERPMIKFTLNASSFHSLFHGDGTAFTKGEASVCFAKGYISLLKQLYAQLAQSEFVDLQALKNAKQGGGGGGFNRGGNQGGGFNRGGQQQSQRAPAPAPAASTVSDDFSDDLPF